MSLLEQIESLGARVEAGGLKFEDAVQALVDWAEGDLSHAGAREWLEDWRGARGYVGSMITSIPSAIEALEATERATTPEARAGATAAADQAMARLRDVAASTDGEPGIDSDRPDIR